VVRNQESGLGQSRGLRLAVVVAIAWSAACRIGEWPFREDYARLRAIEVGMTEIEVRDPIHHFDATRL